MLCVFCKSQILKRKLLRVYFAEWRGIFTIRNCLPDNIVQIITAMHPPSLSFGTDSILWKHSHGGNFRVSTTFKTWAHNFNNATDPIFKCMWSWTGPERIRSLLWKITRNVLPTNAFRARQGIVSSGGCLICLVTLVTDESSLHILRETVLHLTVYGS